MSSIAKLEFLAAIDQVGDCSRAGVRQEFETRFTSRRMAQDYVRIYQKLSKQSAIKASQDWRDRIAIGNRRPRRTVQSVRRDRLVADPFVPIASRAPSG
jgi:hypothetical protein